MKVTVIPVVIVSEGLIQKLDHLKIRRRVEAIKTTTFLRSCSLEENCCFSNSREIRTANTDVRNWLINMTRRLRNNGTCGDHPNYSQNTEKSPGLTVTQTPVRNYQLTLTQRIIKGTGRLGGRNTTGDHPNYKYYWERPEYSEESRRLDQTCCHSDSSER